ncbi:hypothetical protein [Bradyrhizobium sp. CCBAU 51765]|nr:hypothetical protein [Bradyrhizobium sp. CCBAU 51765]
MFEINGFDTAGGVSLKQLSLAAALKKAKELVDPAGRVSFQEQAV